MNAATIRAYCRWQELVERGYGPAETIAAINRVDDRIRRAKARYERLLAAEKQATRRLLAK